MGRLSVVLVAFFLVIAFNNCGSQLDYKQLEVDTKSSEGSGSNDQQQGDPIEQPGDEEPVAEEPVVEEPPAALTAPAVAISAPTPSSGDPKTVFTYSVTYKDAVSASLTAADILFVDSGVSCDTPTIIDGETLAPEIRVENCKGNGELSFSIASGVAKSAEGDESLQSDPSSVATVVTPLCPTGFIQVPGNAALGTGEFCVAKYEMKNDGAGNPVSQASGTPYVDVTATQAYNLCSSMSEVGFEGGSFALISNPHWMTIARNAESVAANWSGGRVGSGCMNRGNVGINGTCAYNAPSDPVFGTQRDVRSKLFLSNDEEIWDFSGNVNEWVDWNPNVSGFTLGPTTCKAGWQEFSASCTSLDDNDFKPAGPYTSNHGVGAWSGDSGGAARRGSDWGGQNYAGAFSLQLSADAINSYSYVGFRCIFIP